MSRTKKYKTLQEMREAGFDVSICHGKAARQPKSKSIEPPAHTDVRGFAGRQERARKSESVYRYPFRLLNVINFVTRQP